jgi:hypothetical protein
VPTLDVLRRDAGCHDDLLDDLQSLGRGVHYCPQHAVTVLHRLRHQQLRTDTHRSSERGRERNERARRSKRTTKETDSE